MKNILLVLIIILLYPLLVIAQIHTVSNNPDKPAQFETIQAAVDAAQPGDTIYVYGSNTNYGNVVIRKRLIMVGVGYDVDTEIGYPTQVNRMTFERTTTLAQDPSGSKVMGFDFTDYLYFDRVNTSVSKIKNIEVFRNRILMLYLGDTPGSLTGNRGIEHSVIRNNIITFSILCGSSWNAESGDNLIIANNIFSRIERINSRSAIVKNNIFYGFGNTIKGVIFINNIIIGGYESPSGIIFNNASSISGGIGNGHVVDNSFNNNILFTSNLFNNSDGEFYSPSDQLENRYFRNTNYEGFNTASGNFYETDPLFEGYDFTVDYKDMTNDFRLRGDSPGKNAGTDGADIGIYGGDYPWPDGGEPGSGRQLSIQPGLPIFDYMQIQNPMVNEGDVLKVEVRVRKSN